jgi:thiosulfate sulfurtransferase
LCAISAIPARAPQHFFSQQGFNEVYSLDGGFEVWRSVYPDETESGSF